MILHGLFLCITSFVSGVIFTWLFFSWKMDREDSILHKTVHSLRATIFAGRCEQARLIESKDFLEKTMRLMENSIQERDKKIYQLELALKQKQQEKEQCPE